MRLVCVTASTRPEAALRCIRSWGDVPTIVVLNGNAVAPPDNLPNVTWLPHGDYLGSVPSFRIGTDAALEAGYDVIANFHDDLELLDPEWTTRVIRHFERHPACGLAGFGGAVGLGDADIYQKPYQPMQLARIGFRSNLVDAEVHGARSLLVERVACLDGFSQIGRRAFWDGDIGPCCELDSKVSSAMVTFERPFTHLEQLGMVHHGYDSALGAIAAIAGWETWYLPIRARHYGGQTAVGDPGYAAWAQSVINGGDQGFWQEAHKALYELGRGILPLRV